MKRPRKLPQPKRDPEQPGKTLEELLREGQEQARSALGIKCPKCGCSDLRVGHTERRLGRIQRYRYCRNCGKTVQTFERPSA